LIIGLSGLIGSGKSTVADYLVQKYGFEKMAFADTLKDVCSVLFGWDRALLEGDTVESREWRDRLDPYWSQALQQPVTPRWALQHIGTDVMRMHFDDYIWIYSLYNKLLRVSGHTVITDCRFYNELNAVKLAGGSLWSVHRGPQPIWWAKAVTLNSIDPTDTTPSVVLQRTQTQDTLVRMGIHPSEYSWAGYDYAAKISNNGTKMELYSQVDLLLKTANVTPL
jgi:hypothetical protein